MKIWLVALVAILVCASLAIADDLDGYTFVKISGADARAVVKSPQGENRLVASGDMLGEATITEIVADRVVLEQSGPDGTAILIVTVKDGHQQVRRLQQKPVKVQTVSVEPGETSKQSGK